LFDVARLLLAREADGTAFRLIGIGASPLMPGDVADLPDLADPTTPRRAAAQAAIDALRGKFGAGIIGKGRGFSR
jgi:DNA polymerase-4